MAPEIKYTKLFIDNEWVNAKSGKTFEAYNPANGSVITSVAEGDKEDINLAVAAAKRAFHRNSEWRLMDASQRGEILRKLADLIERDSEYLASVESANNGCILQFASYVMKSAVRNVRYVASLADKIQGDTIPLDGDMFTYTLKQPVGVCGLILPWNVPILMFLNKVCTALAAAGANNLKRVTLELGGKSPLVIMNDANLPAAVAFACRGVFTLQGQICIAASRLFVQSGIYDQFVQACVKYAQSLKIGSPSDPTTQHGPQVDETMMNKVLGYIQKGQKEGAKLMTGGKRFGNSGYYIEPTVFADVKDDMTIAKEEIFGPVQSIFKFETIEEVIDRANQTNYGLAAGIFTNDLTTALQYSKHVEAGTVWVNNYLAGGPQAPFGGFKESGLGRENGLHCVDEYLEVKTVIITQPKQF
ncbi:hypothetical protein K1T71_005668 [Dendrolimus kikuchii]|uniref:Uncharacterized protein n=1 Tax=Dendrolimus kikuchii TaxID=765133 RepID=A0ACC1D4S7_9NEOP|nr:hypothetical protein K1T71_005668 [Dendrolimus kikuchii]